MKKALKMKRKTMINKNSCYLNLLDKFKEKVKFPRIENKNMGVRRWTGETQTVMELQNQTSKNSGRN